MSKKSLPGTKYLMFAGIVLMVFGVVAVLMPAMAGTAVVMVIGGLLLVAGVVQFLQGLRVESWTHKLLPMVLGVITTICGIAVLAHPFLGMSVLALVLAVFFFVEGVWKIIASFSYRAARGWLAMFASGALAIVLGILIWSQWPLSGLWAVGILVGVDLMMTGASMVVLAVTMRKILASE
jgi:uncharacterized membrane protein HdeD (DUF308 family)